MAPRLSFFGLCDISPGFYYIYVLSSSFGEFRNVVDEPHTSFIIITVFCVPELRSYDVSESVISRPSFLHNMIEQVFCIHLAGECYFVCVCVPLECISQY